MARPTPKWLIDGSSLLSLGLTVLAVWALVDKWEEKVQADNPVMQTFRKLVTELEMLKPGPDGLYDDAKLTQFEWQAKHDGRAQDDLRGVSERVKQQAREKAERKYSGAR